jgi:hypothetical protein
VIAPQEKYKTGTVCLDFDGVLARFSDDIEDFGEPIEGAAEAIRELKKLGYRVVVQSARPNRADHIRRLGEYLASHGMEVDEVFVSANKPWPSNKPLADLYVDDRGLRFDGDWKSTLFRAKALLNGTCPPLKRYEELLQLISEARREEVLAFDRFLRAETTWLTSPASTRFHLAQEGGLLEHSVNVAETLLKMRSNLAPNVSVDSCLICAIFHDVGKVGFAGRPYYLPNPSHWHVRNRGIRYITNPEITGMDTATRSLFLVAQHVKLSPEEAQAIRYHDGQYVPENKFVAHKEEPLTRLLQYADNWSGGVIEEEIRNDR